MDKDLALAGLAHDLNNVLQTVAQVADLLSTDPKWAAESELLIRCAGRGRAILESLREESKPIGLRELALRAASETAGIEVSVTVPEDLEIVGKPFALERALLNLIWNSRRAGARCVSIGASLEADRDCRIVVADDGPGIAEPDLPRIFTPGFSRNASTGLGLQIVRSIVESHGGTIAVTNPVTNPVTNRGGACFEIRIPQRR